MHLVTLKKSWKCLHLWLKLVYFVFELLVWKLHGTETEEAFVLPLCIWSEELLQWALGRRVELSLQLSFPRKRLLMLPAIDGPKTVPNTLQLTVQVPSECDTHNTCFSKDAWQTSVLAAAFPQAIGIRADSCAKGWQRRCRTRHAHSCCCGHPANLTESGLHLLSRKSRLVSTWMATACCLYLRCWFCLWSSNTWRSAYLHHRQPAGFLSQHNWRSRWQGILQGCGTCFLSLTEIAQIWSSFFEQKASIW